MRVLFWSETFWPRVGGVETLAAHLLPALRARGHEFVVVTWAPTARVEEISFEGIPVHRLPFFDGRRGGPAESMLPLLERVRALKHAFLPDIVHVNSYGRSAWFHLMTHQAAPVPTLLTLHQPLPADSLLEDSVVGRLVATSASITCCSRYVRERSASAAPAAADRMQVIQNALPTSGRQDPQPPPEGPPMLLYVGRLVPDKGADWLPEVVAGLLEMRPQARLVIAGDGPLRPSLERRVAEAGLEHAISFRGEVAPGAVDALIDRASIVLVPSREEGFGLVALEAALRARPVVATRTGGLQDVIMHGQTGLLSEPGDAGSFVQAVRFLLEHPQTAQAMGLAGRARALATFRWDRCVGAYSETYATLAGAETASCC